MGKRKERRHAALSNAGRRVKLDLFAEPSGGLGGSSVNGEVGGGIDPTQRAGLPNSPSSSDQPPQNPLLLLGQYSDDELDEESSKKPNHAVAENSPSDHVDQEGPTSDGKEVDFNAIEDIADEKVEPRDMERDSTPVDILQHPEGGDSGEGDGTASADKCKEVDSTKFISVTGSGTSDAQSIGDVSSGWRIVMHEETNQYYYWNTETGETSWEVPDVYAQTTSTSDQKAPENENVETALVDTNAVISTLGIGLDSSSAPLTVDGSTGANLINQSQEVVFSGLQIDESVEGCKIETLEDKNWVTSVYQNESQSNHSAASIPLGAALTNEIGGMDLCTDLMRQCECLLERLKSLKGYGNRLQCHEQMSKYILELDIRLSDIQSLSSYGSTLLPFWVHSQSQLKKLEDAINNEIYYLAVSAQMNDYVEATANNSIEEKEKSGGSVGKHSDSDRCENNRKSEFASVAANCENDSHSHPCENVYTRHVLSPEHSEGGAVVSEKVNATSHLDHSGEDDMDVDMEVEDEVPESIGALGDDSSTKFIAPARQPGQPNTPAEYPTLTSGNETSVPPPPEEDLIPPPPPDSDQVPPPPPDSEQVPPPPPPDEPPEPAYPLLPSYPETHQPLPYTEQYNLPYPDPNFQYYGQTVAVPSNNLYGHADGSQVGVSHTSLYYETVANTYVETTPVIVSPVEPVAYYNLQDGSMPSLPDVRVESSCLHSESVPGCYDAFASDQIRTVDKPAEAGQNLKLDVSAVVSETITASEGLSSNSFTTETPSTTNVTENVSAPAINPGNAAKVQSKVPRSKKRTVAVAPSLRSNKKVSSLVDKWKAAKEELNENEENEPENAYEMLEKKRQREIEEWHAKQIASGEAKDNANFQPLGSDWRERVKRRRAQAAKQDAKTPPGAPIVENKQPDVAELSKGLPSGWQAYWDEASKQVYYGNVITSETTWCKPTK